MEDMYMLVLAYQTLKDQNSSDLEIFLDYNEFHKLSKVSAFNNPRIINISSKKQSVD